MCDYPYHFDDGTSYDCDSYESGDHYSNSGHEKLNRIPDRKTSRPPGSLIPDVEPEPEPETSWTLARSEVTTKKPRTVCRSPECIHLAHTLHNYRDPTVDPCQDFYKAACGKYNEHTTVAGVEMDKRSSVFNKLIGEFLMRNETSTSKSEKTMRMLFAKCQADRNLKDLNDRLKNIWKEVFQIIQTIGSWPTATSNWDESEFDLNSLLANVTSAGIPISGFFKINVEFSMPLIDINPVLDIKELTGHFSKETVKAVLKLNNIQVDEQVLKDDWKSYEAFEKQLSQLNFSTNVDMTPLIEMQHYIPSVNFQKIFENFKEAKGREDMWSMIKDNILTSNDTMLFERLETLIKSSSKRTLANFIIFRTIRIMTKVFIERSTSCVSEVIKELPLASLRVFVRNHFDKENLKITSELVEDLKKSYIEMFEQSAWLHEETRKNAILKVKMMGYMIGYTEEFEKPGALDKIFESLNLLMEQKVDYVAGLIGLIASERLVSAGASYQDEKNWLFVRVPLLDDPIFDSTYPAYANIAGVGYVIGHEIGHGFDPNSRKKNEKGEEKDWWTNEDSIEYDKRAQCLIEKYNDYDDPTYGRNLNGSTTINEVVADILGAETAWKTYKSSDMSDEQVIFGFEDFGLDKTYFHIAAMTWCSSREVESLETKLKRVHATHSFRVNGVFSNMKAFAETFNCPIGSPMNPEKKCEMF